MCVVWVVWVFDCWMWRMWLSGCCCAWGLIVGWFGLGCFLGGGFLLLDGGC